MLFVNVISQILLSTLPYNLFFSNPQDIGLRCFGGILSSSLRELWKGLLWQWSR